MFILPTYHLRRVNPKTNHTEELILLGEVTKFGRNADNVDVVLTSAVYSNMISRDHAVITGTVNPSNGQIVGYKIRDNSLNGTYIDDKRVKDEMVLHESCVIKFGHMNGAAIKAGVAAPQANAEFSFIFEKLTPNRRYLGWEGHERRKTVVCTGDGKFMTETGEDHRLKRKPPVKEPVSSTTAPIPTPFPIQSTHPPVAPLFNSTAGIAPDAIYQMMLQQQQQQQGLMNAWPGLNGRPFPQPLTPAQQPQLAGLRGQFASGRPMGQSPQPPPQLTPQPPLTTSVVGVPSTSAAIPPIRSPPVECDSSVPSPPKNGADTRTGHADSSSQHSPRRAKDDDEDSFSVPDSPPRAPRPHDVPGRSVTNSPAPPSPKPVEKVETPKEEIKTKVVAKKPATPGKVPKSGGGGEKKSNKEVDRLLTDLTEGSFMMQARRKSEGGAGSERRKMLNEGKKSVKRPVSKNKLHRQLSSASSDEESDDDETSGVPMRLASGSASRPSMVGKKASSMSTPKRATKRSGAATSSRGKKEESDDSDPYEETDEDSEGETKNGKRKIPKKSTFGSAKKEKSTPKAKPKKKQGKKKKKKGSDESSEESWGDEETREEEEEDVMDTEQCECGPCKSPKADKVEWVQCDGCEKWYHNFCIFGANKPYQGRVFFCGCNGPVAKKRKSKG